MSKQEQKTISKLEKLQSKIAELHEQLNLVIAESEQLESEVSSYDKC